MDNQKNKISCPECDKCRPKEKVISSDGGAVILYGMDTKKITYKAKNNKNYDV